MEWKKRGEYRQGEKDFIKIRSCVSSLNMLGIKIKVTLGEKDMGGAHGRVTLQRRESKRTYHQVLRSITFLREGKGKKKKNLLDMGEKGGETTNWGSASSLGERGK